MIVSRSCLWLSLALIIFFAGLTQAAVAATHPYKGVTHITHVEISPRAVSMHIVQIDVFLANPSYAFRDDIMKIF